MLRWAGPKYFITMEITDYVNGTPITPGVTYKLGNADANTAWLLASDRPVLFKLTATAPTDSTWSNIQDADYIIRGNVQGQLLNITNPNGKYFVVATNEQDPAATVESAYATVALKPLGFDYLTEYPVSPLPDDGSAVAPGFYSIANLTSGKLYSINVSPDLGGLKETKPNPEMSYALLATDTAGAPRAFLAGGVTTKQLVFVATEATAVLNLQSTIADSKFFVSIRNFSLGSGGGSGSGFDPASNQDITGAWTFSNITVANPTQDGHAANKAYVDAAVSSVPTFNPAEAQTITGQWEFQNGLTRVTKASPDAPDIMNKDMVDATITATLANVPSLTMADGGQIILGNGANAVKILGAGSGASVIEGTNNSSLSIAVPLDLQESVAMHDLVEFPTVGTEGRQDLVKYGSTNGSYYLSMDKASGNLLLTNADADPITRSIFIQVAPTGAISLGGDLTVDGTFTSNTEADVNKLLMKGVTGMAQADAPDIRWQWNGATLFSMGFRTNDAQLAIRNKFNTPILLFNGDTGATTVGAGPVTVKSATAFQAGVTMSQTLNVSGIASFSSGIRIPETAVSYFGGLVQVQGTATGGLKITGGGSGQQLDLVNMGLSVGYGLNALKGIALPTAQNIYFGSASYFGETTPAGDMVLAGGTNRTFDIRKRVKMYTTPAADIVPTSGLNAEMGDARYIKLVSLTLAEYQALTTKDMGTIYHITDSNMWAIGDKELVTADMPA